MLKAISDNMFLDEERNDGDFSKALDWVLTTFRNKTEFSALIDLLTHYSKYQRGSRTKEDIEKTKQFLALLKGLENSV
jgi:hypothetical protein